MPTQIVLADFCNEPHIVVGVELPFRGMGSVPSYETRATLLLPPTSHGFAFGVF